MTLVLADAALSSTIALIAVFFVLFPVVVQGIIMFAVAVALGERQENLAYGRGDDVGSSQG